MERILAAEDHDDRTLESVTSSWDEKHVLTATAFDTAAAFQLVYKKDSLRSLRNLPFRNQVLPP